MNGHSIVAGIFFGDPDTSITSMDISQSDCEVATSKMRSVCPRGGWYQGTNYFHIKADPNEAPCA